MIAATGNSEAAFVIRGAKSSMEAVWVPFDTDFFLDDEIGRASCRERV